MMNKLDLFAEKVETSPLVNFFPDYRGGSLEEAKMFMQNKILALNPIKERRIHPHFSTATGELRRNRYAEDLGL